MTELDPYPFKTPSGAHVTIGLARWAGKNNPEWTMTFAPRPEYEQDESKYL